MMQIYAAIVMAVASATSALAQAWTYNSSTGVFTCPFYSPNGAFCADTSLSSNIIIRCSDGVGQPGNCVDNLSGTAPVQVFDASCWQTTETSGDAVCAKNCIVYGASGNFNGILTLPDCTPTYTSDFSHTASVTTMSVTSETNSVAEKCMPSLDYLLASPYFQLSSSGVGVTTVITSIAFTATTSSSTKSTIYTNSDTVTHAPPGSRSQTSLAIAGSSARSDVPFSKSSTIILATGLSMDSTRSQVSLSNGTSVASSARSNSTATPIGPTTSAPVLTNGAATTNSASILAALGLIIACFL